MSTAINGSQEIILIFNGSNHFSAFHVDFSLRRPVFPVRRVFSLDKVDCITILRSFSNLIVNYLPVNKRTLIISAFKF